MIPVKIKLAEGATKPFYATKGAAGFDLASNEDVIIYPGETRVIKTGLFMEIPEGYEVQVRPRSGTSLKTSLRVANAPGTIDSDYRGEVGIIIQNVGMMLQTINNGERIAQGVIKQVEQAEFIQVTEIGDSERGTGGFGSTGVKAVAVS